MINALFLSRGVMSEMTSASPIAGSSNDIGIDRCPRPCPRTKILIFLQDISQSFVNGAENLEKRKKAESFREKKAGSRDLTSGREHTHVVTKLRYPIPSCHLKLWIEE